MVRRFAERSRNLFQFVVLFCCVLSSTCTANLPEYCGKVPGNVKASVEASLEGYVLKQANVFIRHGDRTKASYPINDGYCWPGDNAEWDCSLTSISHPAVKHDQHMLAVDRVYRKVYMEDREPMKGSCPLGALTFEGYSQQETNGMILNQLYVKTGFLKQNFSYTDIYIRSDDMHRTMQSAQGLIRGMYQPAQETTDRAEVIDIHTMDPLLDDIMPNSRLCPKLAEYQKEFLNSPAFLNHYRNVTQPLLKELQKALGYNKSLNIDDMDSTVDCVHTHQCHNFAIPATITPDLFARMVKDISDRDMMQLTYPTLQKSAQVGIGFLVSEMWQAMQKAMEGQPPKFLLYSGHDYTLFPMLVAFNICDGQWPPYASMLRFELFQSSTLKSERLSDMYAVRIVFNDKEIKPPYCAESPCALAQFEKYITSILPVDPSTTCKVTDPSIMKGPLGHYRRYPLSGGL